MSAKQILYCCTHHRDLNARYHSEFLWGNQAIRKRPSGQDIARLMSAFALQNNGAKMRADYAQRVAVALLNP